MDWMINYIQLAWKLVCMLRTYRTYNSTVGFSKYKLNNKLLDGVTLFKVTPGVTLTQPTYIYIHSLRLIWFDLTQNSVLISQFSWFKLNFFDKVMEPTQSKQLQEPRKTIPMPSRSSTTSLNKNHNTHIFSEMKSREREHTNSKIA